MGGNEIHGPSRCTKRDRHSRRVTMTSKIIKYVLWAGMLVCALSVSRFVTLLDAQQSGTSATDAMQKARVLDRLAPTAPAETKATAPGFVIHPAWLPPLPTHSAAADLGR